MPGPRSALALCRAVPGGLAPRAPLELAARRVAMDAKGKDGWKPGYKRTRNVTTALRAYAAMATSASRGAVRDVTQVEK